MGRFESENWDIYPVLLPEQVPLPGSRGRLESELVEKGGGGGGQRSVQVER